MKKEKSDKLRAYIELTRPFTLLPPLLGILSGAVCAWGSAHNPDPSRALRQDLIVGVLVGSLCAAALNAASNILNQIADFEIDRVNKPSRPLPSGRISVAQARLLSLILYLVGTLPTWFVVPYPRTTLLDKFRAPLHEHFCFFLYIAAALATLVYSLPAFGRTKRLGWLANFTIAVPRGTLLKVAGWSMVAPACVMEAWWIGAVFGLFLLGASSTKDFSDMEGDRAGGCRTLPIIYGPKRAAQLMAPFLSLPWLLIPVGAMLHDAGGQPILTGNVGALVFLGILLFLWGVYTTWLMLRDPWALARIENHPSWTHMYLMMMAAQVGFATAYVL